MSVSVIKLDVPMSGGTGSTLVDAPTITPKFKFINVINMTDYTVKLAKTLDPMAASPLVVFGPFSTLSIPITPEMETGFSLVWQAAGPGGGQNMQIYFSYDSLGYNQCYAPSFTYANGAMGMTINNDATVKGEVSITDNSVVNVKNEPGGELTVAGTIAIEDNQKIEIAGTPTVAIAANQSVNVGNVIQASITSGSVNANITNATIKADTVYATGTYDSPSYINQYKSGTGKVTLLAAGGYISKIWLTVRNLASAVHEFWLYLGSNTVHVTPKTPGGDNVTIQLDFPNGVYNAGLFMDSAMASPSFDVKGCVLKNVNTPRPRVNTIV